MLLQNNEFFFIKFAFEIENKDVLLVRNFANKLKIDVFGKVLTDQIYS